MGGKVEQSGFDIASVKSDLAQGALQLDDPAKAKDAFGRIHAIQDAPALLAALDDLARFFPAGQLEPLRITVLTHLIGNDFLDSPLKKELALAVVRSAARETVFAWLRAISEEELKGGLFAVLSAIEDITGIELAGYTDANLQPRNTKVKHFAREVVELRVAKPDIRTKNLMQVLSPETTKDIDGYCRKVLDLVRAALGDTTLPARAEATEPIAKAEPPAAEIEPPAEAKPPKADDEPEDAALNNHPHGSNGVKMFFKDVAFSLLDDVMKKFSDLASSEQEKIKAACNEKLREARKEPNPHFVAQLAGFMKRTGVEISPPMTDEEFKKLYHSLVVNKRDKRMIGRYLGVVSREFCDLTGTPHDNIKALEKKWGNPPEQPKVLKPEEEKSFGDIKRRLENLRTAKQDIDWNEIFTLAKTPECLLLYFAVEALKQRPDGTHIADAQTFLITHNAMPALKNLSPRIITAFVQDAEVSADNIKRARRLCEDENNRDVEIFERCGREFVKAQKGRFGSFDARAVQCLDTLEKLLGRDHVFCRVLIRPDSSRELIKTLIGKAKTEIEKEKDTGEKEIIADRFAQALHLYHNSINYRSPTRTTFYAACRAELQPDGSHLDRAMAAADFPDYICGPNTNKTIFFLLGSPAQKTQLREALRNFNEKEMKLWFMHLVRGELVESMNQLIFAASGCPGEFQNIAMVLTILLNNDAVKKEALEDALKKSNIGKASTDWDALQPNEQQEITKILGNFGL